jgi:hypothetical protein
MPSNRQCPECHVTLTRYQWSKLWWMSSIMSGRLVQPCAECGAKLRLSSMTLISSTAAILLIAAATMYLFTHSSILLFIALALLLVILVATMATRIEVISPALQAQVAAAADAKPERIGKIRL